MAAVTPILAEHAHRYGVPAGAGSTLLQVMLDEVGVPTTVADIVRHSPSALRHLFDSTPASADGDEKP